MRQIMDDIVHLGDSSQCAPTQVPFDVYGDIGSEYVDDQPPLPFGPPTTRGGVHVISVPNSPRLSSAPSQSQPAHPHKVRGPNWTEAEMLVLIGQKPIEWGGRHNCNQPSLAKFVYGTTAWKLVLAGCMDVVDFGPGIRCQGKCALFGKRRASILW